MYSKYFGLKLIKAFSLDFLMRIFFNQLVYFILIRISKYISRIIQARLDCI